MSLLDPRAVRDWCKRKFLSNDDLLKTKEAVEANTEEGKAADALVVKEVFQSVSNGKSLVASAITDKGVQTDAAAAFQEMAANIRQIESGGGGSLIESPYLFEFYGSSIPFSTQAGSFTFPLMITKIKRFVIKTFQFNLTKNGTSNASGNFYFQIRGILESGGSISTIRQWSGSLTAAQTSKDIVNIYNVDTELDLTGFLEVTDIRVGKYSASGTVLGINANITFKAEVYF